MSWDYADLSKRAKSAGGPEKLLDLIESAAKKDGIFSMFPWLGLALALGIGIGVSIKKLIDHFRGKKKLSKKELEQAKAELIQGIKDYDKAHPEVEESECKETKGE